jgi:hypothetical protein
MIELIELFRVVIWYVKPNYFGGAFSAIVAYFDDFAPMNYCSVISHPP